MQSHFLRQGKEQRHYVMTLFSVCSTFLWCHLTAGVARQHLSKAELQKMKCRNSEVQTNSFMLHWITKHIPSDIYNSTQISSLQ